MVIQIENYKLPMKIGHFTEEQVFFRPVFFSIRASLNLIPQNESEDLDKTLDYIKLVDTVKSHFSKKKVKLLETVVFETGELLLKRFPIIENLDVTVKKSFLITPETRGASISLSHYFKREKNDFNYPR